MRPAVLCAAEPLRERMVALRRFQSAPGQGLAISKNSSLTNIFRTRKSSFPVSSEIFDLLLFVSYFASQSKGIRFGVYVPDVCCTNFLS